MILATAARKDQTVHQLDVKSAFLHGEISEDVYVQQPKGYEVKGSENLVCKLHKALYGFKRASRAWFSRIEGHFVREGFQRCKSEHIYSSKRTSKVIFLWLVYMLMIEYTMGIILA